MSIKLKDETALAMPSQSLDELRKMLEAGSSYLPKFKIFWPVEATEHSGIACVVDGGSIERLEKPYRITVIKARKLARHSAKEEDGKQTFKTAYEGGKGDETYQYLKAAQPNTKGIDLGTGVLLAIFTGDKCVFAVAEVFRSMESYLKKVFQMGILQNGVCVRIDCIKHLQNMKSNKDNPSMKWFDSAKFTQYEQEEVTSEQKALLEATHAAQSKQIKAWEER